MVECIYGLSFMLFYNSEFESGSTKIAYWFAISFKCFENCIKIVLLGWRQLKIFIYVPGIGSSLYQKHVCFDLTIGNVSHRPIKNVHTTSLEFLEVLKNILILPLEWCWSIHVLKIDCTHLELVDVIGTLEYLYYVYVHQEQG